MKTLIAVYCLLLTGFALAQPWSDVTLSQPTVAAAAAASCTTSVTNRSGATYDTTLLGFFSANTNATKFVAPATETICSVKVSIYRLGSPGFNLTATLLNDSSGSPGSVVAQSSTTIAANTLGTTEGQATFEFSASLTSGNVYWIAVKPSAAGDGSNHVLWATVDGFVSGALKAYTGSSWDEVNNRLGKMEVMK